VPTKTIHEVWPDAPEILAPHFVLLYDVFTIYAGLHFPEEETEMVTGHDFYHFLRTFDLIADRDDFN
jgi:hypothetical protein